MTTSLRVGRVGIVGTGAMGRPLIERVRTAGHPVSVFARRRQVREELAADGVTMVESLADLGADCAVVIVYVFSDSQVREVVFDAGLLEAMQPGSTLIIHTTGSPETARAIAGEALPREISVVDAPGSGGPAQVAAATLTLLAGGDEDAIDRLRPLFAAYATNVVRFGPVGAGQAMKLINNLLFSAHVQLALEAARIAQPYGIDVLTMADTLRSCSGASAPFGMIVEAGSVNALLSAGGPFIHKDAQLTRHVAVEAGISLGSFDAIVDDVLESVRPYREHG